MFCRKKRYKITFNKTYQAISWGTWAEVTDGRILSVLGKLKDKYDFEILGFNIRGCFEKSKVSIKCKKEIKNNIFIEFCKYLSDEIENAKVS